MDGVSPNEEKKPEPSKHKIWPESKSKWLALIVPAVLGTAIGAGVQYYLQLAKPDVTLLDVTVPTVERIKDTTKKIQVSDRLRELTTKSENLPDMKGEISVTDLTKYATDFKHFGADAGEDIAWIDGWLPRIGQSLSTEDKRTFLLGLGDHRMIDATMTGGLARSEEKYAAPSAKDLAASPILFQYQPGDPGFKFYLLKGQYHFFYRDNSFDPLLKPAVEALARFNDPYVKKVLSSARQDIEAARQEMDEFSKELEKIVLHTEGLYVRVLVVNRGGSPVSLTPWATLRLYASGARPDFVVPLHSADSSYTSVKPGESQLLSFESLETVEQIDAKYPAIEDILKSETVTCRLAIKRADLSGVGGWFRSPIRVLTANEDIKPEALAVGNSMDR